MSEKTNLANIIVKKLEEDKGIIGIKFINDECGAAPPTGALIAVEGIDGAGLSTYSEILAWVLKKLAKKGSPGQDAFYTKEPTLSSIGFLTWQAMKGGPSEVLKIPHIMALLFAADRQYHLHVDPLNNYCDGILNCLKMPIAVVTDRYKYSSIAYQSQPLKVGREYYPGVDREWLWIINAYAPPPHILIYLSVDIDTALERIYGERWTIQLYEAKDFLELVQEEFKKIVKRLEDNPELDRTKRIEDQAKDMTKLWLKYKLVDPCIYPWQGGRYPLIIEHDSTNTNIIDSLYSVTVTVLSMLEGSGIISLVTK
ncbi:MAG: dTMP kinase [Desulfurococcales archaeon]|nr:dTMP kinase [Desulfurococcales archaeon]